MSSDSKVVLDAIRRIVQVLRNFSKSTERDIGLSTAQIYILQSLSASKVPLTVNELANATHTHQSSASVVVSKLVNRKLIIRTVDENDSRSVRLSITNEGKYLLSKSPQPIQERLTKALTKMSSSERKGLVIGLQALIQHAGMQDAEALMLMED